MRRFRIPPFATLSTLLCPTVALLSGCVTTDEEPGAAIGLPAAAFAEADKDDDGKLSEEELASHQHQEALAEFDLNDDKLITAKEWAAVKPTAGENDENFDRLDKDGDGRIDEDEALDFISGNENFTDSFEAIDQNQDSHLHWKEVADADPESVDFSLFPKLPPAPESGESDSTPASEE